MHMLTMTVVVRVRPDKQGEFLQAVRSLNGDGEKPQGLRKSTLCQETNGQSGFGLIYEWETQEDCERYLGGEKFKVLLGALKVLCEKSEIRYGDVSEKSLDLGRGTLEPVSGLQNGSESF